MPGVLGHLLGEIGTKNREETGVILDLLGIEQLASRNPAFEQDGLERPQYIAAHIPAGPAPMITSNSVPTSSRAGRMGRSLGCDIERPASSRDAGPTRSRAIAPGQAEIDPITRSRPRVRHR